MQRQALLSISLSVPTVKTAQKYFGIFEQGLKDKLYGKEDHDKLIGSLRAAVKKEDKRTMCYDFLCNLFTDAGSLGHPLHK